MSILFSVSSLSVPVMRKISHAQVAADYFHCEHYIRPNLVVSQGTTVCHSDPRRGRGEILLFCIDMVKIMLLDKSGAIQGRNAVLIYKRSICLITTVPVTTILVVPPTFLLLTVEPEITADAGDW